MESDTCFLSKAGFQNPNTTLSCLCYADFMSDTSAVCNTEVHISAASVNKPVIITAFLSTVFTKSTPLVLVFLLIKNLYPHII